MSSIETFLIKLPINNNNKELATVYTKWQSDVVEIKILNQCEQFSGTLHKNEIIESARDLEIPYDAFHNECHNALTTNNGLDGFSYLIRGKMFVLQKVDTFKISYFEIALTTVENLKDFFISHSIETINLMRSTIQNLNNELREKQNQCQQLETDLEESVESKNTLEIELYTQYSELLNERKNTIDKLREQLSEKEHHIKSLKHKVKNRFLGESDNESNSSDDSIYDAATQKLNVDKFEEIEIVEPIKIINLPKRKRPTCTIVKPTENIAKRKPEKLQNTSVPVNTCEELEQVDSEELYKNM